MRSKRLRSIWQASLVCFGVAVISGCSTTTIVLVRHAERERGSDPPLKPAGQLRAEALVGVADRAGISAIYTTEFLRTQQTAEPLANHLALTPTLFPVGDDVPQHVQDLVGNIVANHRGKTVLVVGHSNTVPMIIEKLGVSSPPVIAETEFDRLFVVTKKQNRGSKLIKAKYGP